jgi:carbohydrate-selective porin OprB
VFKIPRIIVYVLMIGGCIALIPPLVFARMRATPSPNRPIHIFWDMDFQPKFKAQAPNPLFADGRAMRPPVQGSVARGESYVDTHMFEGVVDGQWATALPTSMKLDQATLERGQQRFNIYCSACHGYAGYGDVTGIKQTNSMVGFLGQQQIGDWLGVFAEYGLGQDTAVVASQEFSAGLSIVRPFGRVDDDFGIAYAWTRPNNAYGNIPAGSDPPSASVMETFYRWQITNSMQLTPDLQLSFNPASGDGSTVVSLALRLKTQF